MIPVNFCDCDSSFQRISLLYRITGPAAQIKAPTSAKGFGREPHIQESRTTVGMERHEIMATSGTDSLKKDCITHALADISSIEKRATRKMSLRYSLRKNVFSVLKERRVEINKSITYVTNI